MIKYRYCACSSADLEHFASDEGVGGSNPSRRAMKKTLSFLKNLFGWPFSLLALFFIGRLFFLKKEIIFQNLQGINIFLLLIGILCFLFYYFLRCVLWQQLLKAKGHEIPLKESAFLWSWSMLKRYIPGNIWSFLGITVLFSKRGIRKKEIILSLVTDAQFFLIACSIISALAFSYVFHSLLSALPSINIIVPLLTGAIFLTAVLIIYSKFLTEKIRIPEFIRHFVPDFPPKTNFSFLGIALAYMLFFSLGTYFTISSILFLSPFYISTFVGLFSLSFLVGYISIITPMGLGVREGVITLGLSKFVTLSLAGFASIFSRIILIVSELIFLLIIFFWSKTNSTLIQKIETFVKNNIQKTILIIFTALYTLYFTAASFLRYDNFYTGRFDLGNMDQTVWNTLHGRIFEFTNPNGINSISRLAFHADFILVLFTPFYVIWSNPKMLLLIQTIVIALGAIFVYLISREVLKGKNVSLLFSLLYLFNPALERSNLYDFHPVTLATTFLVGSFYFLIKKRFPLFLLFLFLAAITKEEIWLIASLFGLFITVLNLGKNRTKALAGFSIFVAGTAIFYFLVWYAIPKAMGGQHFALAFYSEFGDSPTAVIKNMIFTPNKILGILLQNGRLTYLFQLFLPLGFLSVLSPFLLFGFPDFLINLLSSNTAMHNISFQYSASITPFLFISAIYGMKFLKRLPQSFYNGIILFVILTASFSAFEFGPLPGAKNPDLDMFAKTISEKKIIEDFLIHIPQKYSISATNNLGSHLSHRQKIFTVPVGLNNADIVAFLLNDPFAQPSLKAQKEMVLKMKNDKNYIQVFKEGDFIVFERRSLYLETNKKKINQVKLFPLSIPALQHRDYKGGDITIEQTINYSNFTSYLISYPSDGLKVYALMNVPNRPKPQNGFPVLILNHGYINPANYDTFNSYKGITDYFSSNGYLVIKPDYRGNGKSETDTTSLMRFAYPVDVMNLISSLDSVKEADLDKIFLWSHSMGGEVSLTVLEIAGKKPELAGKIKAASFWAPVTDPAKWFSKSHLPQLPEARISPFPYQKTFEILGTPDKNPNLWESLSPLNYLSDITTKIQLSHGTADKSVPYSWSVELNDKLKTLGKNITFFTYENNDHNLSANQYQALQRDLEFFDSNL